MNKLIVNPILSADSYKLKHYDMYPSGMNLLYSSLICRNDKYASFLESSEHYDHKVVFFGLQYIVKDFLINSFNSNFFGKPKHLVIEEYKHRVDNNLGVEVVSTNHIEALYDLGYLPIEIKAVEEGSVVNLGIPLISIVNTHPDFAWLVNYLETTLLNSIWKPISVATVAHEYKKLLVGYNKQTSDVSEFVNFQGHDFSMRGQNGPDDAMVSGGAFLTSFKGSDTIPAAQMLEAYYGANSSDLSFSVSASEHSVMCTNILYNQQLMINEAAKDNRVLDHDESMKHAEIKTYKELLKKYTNGILSLVSDQYDYFQVLTDILPILKYEIMSRNGKLVIRPDCYSEDTSILTPEGWKLFKDLTQDDLVAQVKEDGSYEFVKPIKYVAQEYEGDMYHFKDHHGKLDLLVTPNHRMIFNLKGKIKIEEAEKTKIGNWNKCIMRSAKAPSQNKQLTPMERLKIAFQADGSYQSKGDNSIRFSFSKKRKIVRLTNILNELQLPFKIYQLSDGRVEFNIKINSELLLKDFSWVDISNLCSNWCEEFIEELSYWDATRRNESRFKFDTTIKEVIDIVELIAISAGYGCLISNTEDNRKDIFNDVYTANILKNNLIGGQAQSKEKVYYSGKVYCVQVPTGMLLVKRGRGTAVCGNSGDPIRILCGYTDAEVRKSTPYEEGEYRIWNSSGSYTIASITEAEKKGTIQLLWEAFGGTVNSKGFKVLDSHIGTIYGDALTIPRVIEICERLISMGFSTENFVCGIGAYSLNGQLTRDTFGMAMKATYCQIHDKGVEIYKQPKTDPGKNSPKGLLKVEKVGKEYLLHESQAWGEEAKGELKTVFKNGKLYNETTLDIIRSKLG